MEWNYVFLEICYYFFGDAILFGWTPFEWLFQIAAYLLNHVRCSSGGENFFKECDWYSLDLIRLLLFD